MEKPICRTCQKPKGTLECGPCQASVCRKCAQFVRENTFSFLEKVPAEIQHQTYCGQCFDSIVAPALNEYEATMERARGIIVYLKNQGEETRLIKRSEKPFKVVDCADREETMMRLAFMAASNHFNTLVDVQIDYRKVRKEAYQTTLWNGSAVPTQLDGKLLSVVEWSAPVNNLGTR